jgi:uncharacterized protein YjgD (DUF1641 family)
VKDMGSSSETISSKGFEELLSNLQTLNELSKILSQLKESGALENLINITYGLKTLKDLINDDAIVSISNVASTFLELSTVISENINKLKELLSNLELLNHVLKIVKELKDSGVLETLVNFSYSLKTLRDMLNDDAIVNISNKISSILEITDTINNKDLVEILRNIDVIKNLTSYLKDLEKSGTLDTLINFSYSLKTLKDMLNDDAIKNISETITKSIEVLTLTENFLKYANHPVFYNMVKVIASEETKKALSDPPLIGLGGLIAALRDKDVQRGLGILITILKILGKNYKIE